MVLYYEPDGISIYHGDMRDVLPCIPAADLVVTDPPYVVGLASSVQETSKVGGWADLMNAATWYSMWLAECGRLAAPSGAAWGSTVGAASRRWRAVPGRRWPIQSLLVWDKQSIGTGLRGLRPRYELVALFAHRRFAIPDRTITDIYTCRWPAGRKPTGHPAEKPVPLLRPLIEISGGRLLLDPFAGSGSTLVAARQLGRPAIGVELEERWCELAANHLDATAQDSGPADGGRVPR